ncbi:hypothetical protein GDO81_011945 [Engystomops pustulosus]|uniref:SCAN box domain-containing protein n=1 Tax=Engystomops pustulosus TaxID=76066 RepID=A0AAV7BHS4_ENGPU|nr:hypothetical protein GDO81_011945 [Engystomops pustulosus]
MYDLYNLTNKWLQPEALSTDQIVDRVVSDRFIRALPVRMQRGLGYTNPKSIDDLVSAVERFTATEEYLQDVRNPGNKRKPSSDATTGEETSNGVIRQCNSYRLPFSFSMLDP